MVDAPGAIDTDGTLNTDGIGINTVGDETLGRQGIQEITDDTDDTDGIFSPSPVVVDATDRLINLGLAS